MSEENVDEVLNDEQRPDTGASRTAGRVKDKAGKETKKLLEKAKEGQKKGKYASGFAKIAYYIVGILLIIVMIIGFISFALNMPGAVVEKIMNFGLDTKQAIKILYTGNDISTKISDADKLTMLNYIDDMGYNVVAMGFVQSVTRDSDGNIIAFEEDIMRTDAVNSAEYNKELRNKSIQPSYLLSYILADTRIYVSKNIRFFNKLFKNTDVDNTWGEGMLNIYGEGLGAFDNYEVDRENATLTFKNTHGFFKTDVYQYDIDGWAGRYGTPMELLLAIHASTMMPDLVYEFISNENLRTVVNIFVKEVDLKVNLKLIGPDGSDVDLNLGMVSDEPIPIEFYYDATTRQYGINNKDQIINGLKDGTYTIASLYNGFNIFLDSFNEYATAIGEAGTKGKINELVNSSGDVIYLTNTVPDETLGYYMLGDYVGTRTELLNNSIIYNDISITGFNEANRTVTLSIDGLSFDDVGVTRATALDRFGEALKNDGQLVEGMDLTTGEGREYTRIYYRDIFIEIDQYFDNLIQGGSVIQDNLRYDPNNTYSSRFEQWIDSYSYPPPQTFLEFIDSHPEYANMPYQAQEAHHNAYLASYPDDEVIDEIMIEYNQIIEDIRNDIGVREDTTQIAQALKDELATTVGLSAEQVDTIYTTYLQQEPEIKTYVPGIQSVVKHWYKDLVFQYNNANKGTVFKTEYPGEGIPGYKLYYEFQTLDENYPIQDGEPYVIKGDIVTRDGEVIDTSNGELNIQLDEGTQTVLEDYVLGDGYKAARKLFTQGYYYQYDGTVATANEIAVAKRIESYDEGAQLRVVVENGKLKFVTARTASDSGVYQAVYRKTINTVDAEGNPITEEITIDTPDGATRITETYYITAPMKYVSPVDGDNTEETVESINSTLESLGTQIRRKKVNITNNTTTLNALSMLEGMHSLDADYIYREFKEFLIELGYYSRVELESIETSLLDWFIPGFIPEKWPPIKQDITQYGITLASSANIGEIKTISIDKMQSLDNFIFFTDTDGIINLSTLQQSGNNIQIVNTGIDADSIVNRIISSKPNAICLYVKGSAETDEETQAAKMKQMLQDIRTKLEEQEYEFPDIPVYVLQVLPLREPDILDEASVEEVNKNQRISNYNTKLFNICLNQDNLKFIDATTGLINANGWLSSNFTSGKMCDNIINNIVKKDVSNGGFEEDLTVITPGAGYVTNIEDVDIVEKDAEGNDVEKTVQQITIEFSADVDRKLKAIDKFTLIIKGIAVDEELENNFNSSTTIDMDGNKILEIQKGAVIGVTTTANIQLILRDRNNAILNNIEDYMKLPEKSEITDWEIFYYTPYESGGTDVEGHGPAMVGGRRGEDENSTNPNEVAVGICQWTTLTNSNGSFNNISRLCEWLYNQDPSLCAELATFISWNNQQIFDDYGTYIANGRNGSQLVDAFNIVNKRDHDKFLALQMEYAKNEKIQIMEGQGVMWLFDRPGVVAGTYMSLINWMPNAGWQNVINEGMSNEQIVIMLFNKATQYQSTAGSLDSRWNSQARYAIDVLEGTLDVDDIEEITRSGQTGIYSNGNNPGYIARKMQELNLK